MKPPEKPRQTTGKEAIGLSDVAEDIESGLGSVEAAWKVTAVTTRLLRGLVGVKVADKIFDALSELANSKQFKILGQFKPYQVVRIVLALGCATDASALTQDTLISALNSVHNASRIEMVQRANELAPHQEERETSVQHFLDDVRPHIESVRAQFDSKDPIQNRALRFAFANVFISYDNRISAGEFDRSPEYQERMPQMLGAPIGLEDLLVGVTDEEQVFGVHTQGQKVPLDDLNPDGTPESHPMQTMSERSREYIAFKKRLFEVYASPSFKALQQRVGDSGVLFDYEVLIDRDLAPQALVAVAEKRAALSDMLSLVNPDTVRHS